MFSIKTLTTTLVAAAAIAAPAATAMPVSDPISVSPHPATVVQAPAASNGFDWGDAGIGAGSAVAIVALALGGVVTLRHRSMSPAN